MQMGLSNYWLHKFVMDLSASDKKAIVQLLVNNEYFERNCSLMTQTAAVSGWFL